ncbi:hypothetical protein INR49_013442 [Caranx melampygus]|nr:hypothetical protein INR49_013442 [Caranx melampygus]
MNLDEAVNKQERSGNAVQSIGVITFRLFLLWLSCIKKHHLIITVRIICNAWLKHHCPAPPSAPSFPFTPTSPSASAPSPSLSSSTFTPSSSVYWRSSVVTAAAVGYVFAPESGPGSALVPIWAIATLLLFEERFRVALSPVPGCQTMCLGEVFNQFEALGVVHPGAELTAEHLALAVAQPAVEVIPAVLRYNINRLTAPGFFFFLTGLGEVSEGECPLEEWVGLDTFLFCGATDRSADPGGSGTGHRETATTQDCHNRKEMWVPFLNLTLFCIIKKGKGFAMVHSASLYGSLVVWGTHVTLRHRERARVRVVTQPPTLLHSTVEERPGKASNPPQLLLLHTKLILRHHGPGFSFYVNGSGRFMNGVLKWEGPSSDFTRQEE